PSEQSTGSTGVHVPPAQVPYVHGSARHVVPSRTGSAVQPVDGSHRPISQSSGWSHAESSGTKRQPRTGSHSSRVHPMPSSHAGGCVHRPASQTSLVQIDPSSGHGVPVSGSHPTSGRQAVPVHGLPSSAHDPSTRQVGVHPSQKLALPSSHDSPGS